MQVVAILLPFKHCKITAKLQFAYSVQAMQEALLLYGKAAEGGYHMAWFKEGTILSKEAEANPNHMEACEAAALVRLYA